MGIFSFGKKDDAPTRRSGRGASAGSGRNTSRGARVERRSRRPDRSGDAEAMLLDPTLPEKQRARRRLVGAIALVIAAIVVLPMVLDSHPKPVTDDIAIDIPSRPADKSAAADTDDTQAGVVPDNPSTTADNTAGASGLTPAAPSRTAGGSIGGQSSNGAINVAPAQTAQAPRNQAAAKPRKQPPSASVASTQPTKPADTDALDTRSATDADTESGTPAAPPGARFALELGQFPDDASARNWAAKLKAVGVPAYTERRKQPDGSMRTLLRAGPFPDRAAASAAIAKVREAGLGSGANGGGSAQ